MGKIAFLFPGQGAQTVGMGRELLVYGGEVAHCFTEADDTLGFALSERMLEGPLDQLSLTEYAQPALVTTAIAAWRLVCERTALRPHFVAGHSLGEYAAVCVAGGIDFATALRLVHLRGQAMQRAVPVGMGTMAAMLNMTAEDVTAVCQQAEREVAARPGNTGWDFHGTPVCVPANYNTPGQIVISGHTPAVEQAIRLAKERGARRCIALPVSAPFHSPLMQPAADEMAVALAGVDIADLTVPVIPNVTALEITTGQQVRDHLIRQITGAVLWEASIRRLIDLGVDTFVELGTGRTLTGMLKRIDPSVRAFAVNGPDDLGSISGLVEDTAC